MTARNWLEPKARKALMRTSIARKFTLVDAMVLIAATAIRVPSPIRFDVPELRINSRSTGLDRRGWTPWLRS